MTFLLFPGAFGAAGDQTVNPTPAVASWTALAGTLALAVTVSPAVATANWVVPTPGVQAAYTAAPVPAISTWTALDAGVAVSSPQTVSPAPAVATWVVPLATGGPSAGADAAGVPPIRTGRWLPGGAAYSLPLPPVPRVLAAIAAPAGSPDVVVMAADVAMATGYVAAAAQGRPSDSIRVALAGEAAARGVLNPSRSRLTRMAAVVFLS